MAKAYLYHRNTGHTKPLNVDTTFGRVTGDWTFEQDDVVSTKHGQFVFKGEAVYLVDLGSTNGTFINRKDVEPNRPVLLQDLDELQFGQQEFIYTTQADLSAEQIEEKFQNKKRESLLGNVKKTRENKVVELETQAKNLIEQREKWELLVKQKLEAFQKYKAAFQEKAKALQELQAKAQHLEQNMTLEQKKLEESKIPFYQKQTALQDKLKLLEMANAEPDKQAALKKDMGVIDGAIKKIEDQKVNLPNVLREYKNQIAKLTGEAQEIKQHGLNAQEDYQKTAAQAKEKFQEITDQSALLQDQLEKARIAAKSA